MGIKSKISREQRGSRGFVLLVAVIFASVVLALGTAMSALGYKQQILASTATRSQYAFYAADAALECALFDTQKSYQEDPYSYDNHSDPLAKPACGGKDYMTGGYFQELCYNTGSCLNKRVVQQMFPIAFANPLIQTPDTEALCAVITTYEQEDKPAGTTFVFSDGYDVPCAVVVAGSTNGRRIVTRGLEAHF